MKHSPTLWLVGLAIIIVLIGSFLLIRSQTQTNQPTPTPNTNQTINPSPTETSLPTETSTPSRTTTPSPTTQRNITLTSPTEGATVNRQFNIAGLARVFENTMQIRVRNKSTNAILVNQVVIANSPDTGQFGPYAYQVNLANANIQSGEQLLVEAFQYSANDGSEIDKVSVTVNFRE